MTAENTAVKLYPMGAESYTLVGWRTVTATCGVPPGLAAARVVATPAGRFLLLVCNDACPFSGRSRSNLQDALKQCVLKHFISLIRRKPKPEFVLIATHHQESLRSGGVFKDAASQLAEEYAVTAITTAFGPSAILPELADAFPIRGPRADEVVTLLVEDTLQHT